MATAKAIAGSSTSKEEGKAYCKKEVTWTREGVHFGHGRKLWILDRGRKFCISKRIGEKI